ncbi:MAG: 50S ribosomal protein L24e [Candidatus Thermoplasmatota archaeon]|jgi:large subunit ribosomal protein L24e|nr:50S ribosomal protein L24e [Candidatus Thermoplasmatota archaeon]
METRYCSFCGSKIEHGTGKMYIKRDGSVLYFDNSKCEKNFLKLRREPRRVRWTEEGREEKAQRIKYSKDIPQKPAAPAEPEKKEEDQGAVEAPKEN